MCTNTICHAAMCLHSCNNDMAMLQPFNLIYNIFKETFVHNLSQVVAWAHTDS